MWGKTGGTWIECHPDGLEFASFFFLIHQYCSLNSLYFFAHFIVLSFIFIPYFILSQMATSMEVQDCIYVTMELLSNWGNPVNVGLSKVEFFDLYNEKIFVSPHDVDIRNADNPGDLCCLVNKNLNVRQLGPGCENFSL